MTTIRAQISLRDKTGPAGHWQYDVSERTDKARKQIETAIYRAAAEAAADHDVRISEIRVMQGRKGKKV